MAVVGSCETYSRRTFSGFGIGIGMGGLLWLVSVSDAAPGCGCWSLDALRVENGGPDFFGRFPISDAIHGSLDRACTARFVAATQRIREWTLRRFCLGPWPGLRARLGLAVFGSLPPGVLRTESHSAFVDARATSLTAHCTDRAPRMLAGQRIPDIVINRNLEWVQSPKTGA
jgi:hypothetical protein